MKLALNDEMREIDRVTTEKFGIPGVVLMENAGNAVVDEIKKNWRRMSTAFLYYVAPGITVVMVL